MAQGEIDDYLASSNHSVRSSQQRPTTLFGSDGIMLNTLFAFIMVISMAALVKALKNEREE